MAVGSNKVSFALGYFYNRFKSVMLFRIFYPWVKYDGFVRVMKNTRFAKRDIVIGNRVQFGVSCRVVTDVHFGSNILVAGRVIFIGRNDHLFNFPGEYIWDGARGEDGLTIVEDDVWIGNGCTILAGVTIGMGSIIAAGSVVSRSIPPCEIWGGVPAKKIKDRFETEEGKIKHIEFLKGENIIE
ncbi:acyltransferase [Polaribacter sp. R77954]|uniref:acyltransferase n=1 Tax=Polaribacter sp. R77954 TaxID=3093870 RepID=UPI0037CAD7BF